MGKPKFKFSEVNEETLEEKKERKWEVIGVTVTLVVLVIAILYVWVIKPKKDLEGDNKQALISPSIHFTDTINGDNVHISGKITYYGKKDFYYITKIYKGGKNTYTYPCVSINCKTCNPATYGFTQTTTPTYYEITTYKDNKCTKKSRTFKTKTYQKTNSSSGSNSGSNTNKPTTTPTPALIITQPSQLTYEKSIRVSIKFKHNQNKMMYYSYQNYGNGTKGYKQGCSTIKANEQKEFTLLVDAGSTNRYSEIRLYSNSDCSKQVDMKKTQTFVYKAPSKVYNEGNFRRLRYDHGSMIRITGSQKSTGDQNSCKSFALAYGSYIINPNLRSNLGNKSCRNTGHYGSVNRNAKSAADEFNIIKRKIEQGIPVIIQVTSSLGQHWVTVYGYNKNAKVSSGAELMRNVEYIDPWHGTQNIAVTKWPLRSYSYATWDSVTSAKACNTN